jgi:hypothetical protein
MARFIINRNLDRDLKREVRYRRGLKDKAEDAAEASRSIAFSEAYDEGDYRDSIEAVEENGEVRVVAKDFKAFWIEFGSAHNPRKVAPLRRGAQAAGLRFKGRA